MFECLSCQKGYLFLPGWYHPPCPFQNYDKNGVIIPNRKLYI